MFQKIKTSFVLILIFFPIPSELICQEKTSVEHPEWSYNKVIYEVNLRQYTEEGTFKAFEEHLPGLKEMGVGILWFMPIHPIGEKNRKGTLGSYYAVRDYKAVNPEHGTPEDFKSLVDKVHEMGMYIIIDWVANHTAWDNVWVKEHPEFYTKDSLGNFVPPVADWADVIDLNYNSKELWAAMIDAMKFWVEEYNIDGYRCDVAGMIPVEFWLQVKKELDDIKPVFMLAEAWEPELHQAFDMTYSWDIHHLMSDIAKGKKNANDLKARLEKEKEMYPESAYRMQFTSNHDENSWNGTVIEKFGDGAEAFAALTFVIPGMPLIYSGQEAGLDKRLQFFEKDPIEWKEDDFQKLYTRLCELKEENDALLCGEKGGGLNILSSSENNDDIFAFVRERNGEKIFSVFNLSGSEKNIEIEKKNLILQLHSA
ncbi:MAG: alpha-amylase family glycosyl hydrolase [Ignavibacteria bacterium]|nr:alpha-amylase family glycosyl hydrolase [Ignavibacteria bacterium]